MRKFFLLIVGVMLMLTINSCTDQRQDVVGGAVLSDLAKPIDGRSMRSTSTKVGEDGRPIPHNSDNSRVMPGETKVVLAGTRRLYPGTPAGWKRSFFCR